jgi:predicted nuclease of predicted toxin-antitoxin system
MLRFYTDSHIAQAVAIQLRARGIDVVRCQDVGLDDASDPEHLAYAINEARALITKDDDFLVLHRSYLDNQQTHFGIFYCPDRNSSAIGRIVKTCAEYFDLIDGGAGTLEDDIQNRVIYIP